MSDILDYTIDFTHWLEGKRICHSSTEFGDGLDGVHAVIVGHRTVVVWLTHGRSGTITCTVTTKAGRRIKTTVRLRDGLVA